MSQSKSYRNATLVLSIVVIGLLSWGIYSYLLIESHVNTIRKIKQIEQINTPLEGLVVAQQKQLDSVLTANVDLQDQLDMSQFSADSSGIFFEIQLGKFKSFDLNDHLNELIELRQVTDNGYNSILLARFTEVRRAEALLKDLRKLGLHTAFIVGRIDGRIVDKKEAIQALR